MDDIEEHPASLDAQITAETGDILATTEDFEDAQIETIEQSASAPYTLSFAVPPAKVSSAGADTSSRADNFFRGAKWCVTATSG